MSGKRKVGRSNCSPVSITNMEPYPGNEPLGAKKAAGLDSSGSVRLHIHSRRKRLCDADGISGKAAIDGVVHAGILEDDSPKNINNVSYSQEKTKGEEETVIEIWQGL